LISLRYKALTTSAVAHLDVVPITGAGFEQRRLIDRTATRNADVFGESHSSFASYTIVGIENWFIRLRSSADS
jgi:hypothetical protein